MGKTLNSGSGSKKKVRVGAGSGYLSRPAEVQLRCKRHFVQAGRQGGGHQAVSFVIVSVTNLLSSKKTSWLLWFLILIMTWALGAGNVDM